MADAMKLAVQAGRLAYRAARIRRKMYATVSIPVEGLVGRLAGQGTPIGEFDTLIAAHALAVRVTLVTSNTKHFERVAGLKTENWI